MSMNDGDDSQLSRLLADPSLWLEPDPAVEDRVLGAIRLERPGQVVPLRGRRRVWSSPIVAGLVGAAAAALVAVITVRSDGGDEPDEAADVDATVQLVGTDLAPGFEGTAQVTTEPSGVLIRLIVPGLPRRDGNDFYEGWLKSCDGTGLVPIGTFHDMDRAAGWAGVWIEDYPLLTVTAEQVAGPTDALQGSSGQVVVSGAISACPDT